MDRAFLWLNDHDLARFGIALTLPASELLLSWEPTHWWQIAIALTAVVCATAFASMWTIWLHRAETEECDCDEI
ncbi:hypothetical protein HY970_00255 [Candidatus Kaiserbacteria bacterium]|nr:hypothetical protein [Candidatus Kaiserbacteria bacterium]